MSKFIIKGGKPLKGKIKPMGAKNAALPIIAALTAKGESEINNIELIDRGYEDIENRLRKIGAKIRRV